MGHRRTTSGPVGLYIHVPFCRTRCHFCAFALWMYREDRAETYLKSLFREIHLHRALNSLAGRTPDTLYFGGGTPTTLTPAQLSDVMHLVRSEFGLNPEAEITVEADPDTVSPEGLRHLRERGVNRISFGAQSMEDRELRMVGRKQPVARTRSAVETARSAGFDNINLDLIYGLPGQTLRSWLLTLDAALCLEPAHLSCYALTVEDKTRLEIDIRRSDRTEPDMELQNDMEEMAALRLARVGYLRYEISNYCRPGYASRHNRLYWEGHDYLGLGPSAQSYLDGVRFGTVADLSAYTAALIDGRLPITDEESLTLRQRRREALIFGLRLIDGIPFDRAAGNDEDLQKTIARLTREGLLESTGGRVKLTEVGRRHADTVAVALL